MQSANLIVILRGPVGYLAERKVERPYAVDCEDALDHKQIKTKSEVGISGRVWVHII